MHWPSLLQALLLLLCQIRLSQCQTALLWNPPATGLQAGTLTLINGSPMSSPSKLTNITYNTSFPATPYVILSLGELGNMDKPITIYQSASTRTRTYFMHRLDISGTTSMLRVLKVCWAGVDLSRFVYFYPHAARVQSTCVSIQPRTSMPPTLPTPSTYKCST